MSGPPGGEPGPSELAEGRAGRKRRFGGESADAGPCPWSQPGREREVMVAKRDMDPIMPSFVCEHLVREWLPVGSHLFQAEGTTKVLL